MRVKLTAVHDELKTRYREFFESKFAADLSKEKKYFSSVGVISDAILALIRPSEDKVLKIICETPAIVKELKQPYFGSCFSANAMPTPLDALNKIVTVLADKSSELSTIMQMHCIFAYRIYDKLNSDLALCEKKEALKTALHPASLFNSSARGRIEKTALPTKAMGFARHSVFGKMLGNANSTHVRAVDKLTLTDDSEFYKHATAVKMPVICGASGHTASLLIAAKLYGGLSSEGLSEYAIACFVFLAAGGNHTFHEVMCIAQLIGLPYQEGEYSQSIPSSIKATEQYARLSERFPEFLDDAAVPHCGL